MQRLTLIPAWLMLASIALAAQAQEPLLDAGLLEEEVPEIRRYTVELIVFRYAEDVSVGTEIFEPEIIEPVDITDEDLDAKDELEGEIKAAVEIEEVEEEEPLFQMLLLAEDELKLIDTFDRLDRLDAYEPLLHVGWTQTALPEKETPALDLREFGEPPESLQGEFTLYLSRYLHLVVNLELDADESDDRAAPQAFFGPVTPQVKVFDDYTYYDEPVYAPLRYVIDENRLFKNGETRYFDHPKFGVVAKILRFEEPEVEEIPDDTEFLSPAIVGDQGT